MDIAAIEKILSDEIRTVAFAVFNSEMAGANKFISKAIDRVASVNVCTIAFVKV